MNTHNKNNVVWHNSFVDKESRNRLNDHKSGVVWLTGLSASGKSTIANYMEKVLLDLKVRAYVLDGDNIRHGLNSDLGFSREDRKENLRRIVEVAKLLADSGTVVLCAFIAPYEEDRDYIREKLKDSNFSEIYIKCSIETCIERDPKGQYNKALRGLIKDYTGISSPYEEPRSPDLVINTEQVDVETSVSLIIDFLRKKIFLNGVGI